MPLTAKIIPIGTSRGRGRPRKAPFALTRQRHFTTLLEQSFPDLDDDDFELADTFPANNNANAATNTSTSSNAENNINTEVTFNHYHEAYVQRDKVDHISAINSSRDQPTRPNENFDSTHNRFDPNFESVITPATDDELATLAVNPLFQALTSESPDSKLNTIFLRI